MENKNYEVFKHEHICLVEDHYNPLGIVRSLGEEGIKPIVLLVSKKIRLLNKSKYVKELHSFNSIQEAYDYMIKRYGDSKLKPFIYNGSDNISLFLDQHYEELNNKFYFCNGKGNLEKYLQKYDITLLAQKCGCLIPKEEFLDKGILPNALKFPVFTKASTSSLGGDWKGDSYICYSEEELKDAYSKIKSEKVLVQEFIEKKNEYCIDGISINAGEDIYLPYAAQYYRFSKESYGAYMFFEPVEDIDLIQKVKDIIRGAKYTGIFCIEFLVGKDNRLYFLEVNFRNSGWSYAFTYGGFNLPFRWASSMLSDRIEIEDFTPLKRFTAMSEFEDFEMFVSTKKMKFKDWFRDFKNADCCFIYNRFDNKPFIYVATRFIIKQFLKWILHFFGKEWR